MRSIRRSKKLLGMTLGFLFASALLATTLFSVPVAYAATFTVNSTADSSDASPGDSVCDDGTGACTLRAAIEEANASLGLNTIAFAIPGSGPHTISPGSALPTITDPAVIDGYTQPGASVNTNSIDLGSNAVLLIELDGSSAGVVPGGLDITAGGSTVRGLVINRFTGCPHSCANAIKLYLKGGNVIEGNHIGTDVLGKVALPNSTAGVAVWSPNNTIGGTTPAARNIFSGNGGGAVDIAGGTATGNLVQGNYIGTDVTGTAALANLGGVGMRVDASNNTIGGTTPDARNVISGNSLSGVGIVSGANGNIVEGNYIGTNATGTAPLGNGNFAGVFIANAPNNTIGGTTPGARNIISGNSRGVLIQSAGSTGNFVQGNYIGTDVTGKLPMGNGDSGVKLFGAGGNNTIGGTTPGQAT